MRLRERKRGHRRQSRRDVSRLKCSPVPGGSEEPRIVGDDAVNPEAVEFPENRAFVDRPREHGHAEGVAALDCGSRDQPVVECRRGDVRRADDRLDAGRRSGAGPRAPARRRAPKRRLPRPSRLGGYVRLSVRPGSRRRRARSLASPYVLATVLPTRSYLRRASTNSRSNPAPFTSARSPVSGLRARRKAKTSSRVVGSVSSSRCEWPRTSVRSGRPRTSSSTMSTPSARAASTAAIVFAGASAAAPRCPIRSSGPFPRRSETVTAPSAMGTPRSSRRGLRTRGSSGP